MPLHEVATPFLDLVKTDAERSESSIRRPTADTRSPPSRSYLMTFSIDQYRLDGKVAVVTGAGGRGNSIGRAYALGLARRAPR